MGWDYYTYMSQPVFFVDAIKDYFIKEHKAKEAIMKREQRRAQSGGVPRIR